MKRENIPLPNSGRHAPSATEVADRVGKEKPNRTGPNNLARLVKSPSRQPPKRWRRVCHCLAKECFPSSFTTTTIKAPKQRKSKSHYRQYDTIRIVWNNFLSEKIEKREKARHWKRRWPGACRCKRFTVAHTSALQKTSSLHHRY